MNTDDRLDEFERRLDRLWSILMDYLRKTPLPVITEIEEHRSGTDEVNRQLEDWRDLQTAKKQRINHFFEGGFLR